MGPATTTTTTTLFQLILLPKQAAAIQLQPEPIPSQLSAQLPRNKQLLQHSASSLTSTFSFNDPFTQAPAIYQKESQARAG